MLTITIILIYISSISCLPQVILLQNEKIFHKDFDSCKEPTILWEKDGECYPLGERGPCSAGEVLVFDRTVYAPKCSPNSRILVKESDKKETVETDSEVVTDPDSKPSDEFCNHKNMIYWPEDESCYELLEQGPCQDNQWLVMDSSNNQTATPKCTAIPCADPDNQVFYPPVCQCVDIKNNISSGRYGPDEVCGQHSRFTWTPFGEGICTCENEYLHDEETDVCHKLGTQGPCEPGFLWVVDGGIPLCVPESDELGIRVLDLIAPTERQTRIVKCYVDSKGKCRKTLGLNIQRFGTTEFQEWIASFTPSKSNCEERQCENDDMLWHDGNCYQAASTGPCDLDQWLVVDSILDSRPILRCKDRLCHEDEVLINCTCVSNSKKSRIGLVTSLCGGGEGWVLSVSPYGTGICSCPRELSGEDGKTCEAEEDLDLAGIDFINKRKSELPPELADRPVPATRSNCKLVQDVCVQDKIDTDHVVEDKTGSVQDLVDWLASFPQQSQIDSATCFDDNIMTDVVGQEDNLRINNRQNNQNNCTKSGEVMYLGSCQQLLKSQACSSDIQWLVLKEDSERIFPSCEDKQCTQEGEAFLPHLSKCVQLSGGDWCKTGQQDIDMFGQAVCICQKGFLWYAKDGGCHSENNRGPCEEGQILTKKFGTLEGTCKDSERSEISNICSGLRIGEQGPCPSGYLLMIDGKTGELKCKQSILNNMNSLINLSNDN